MIQVFIPMNLCGNCAKMPSLIVVFNAKRAGESSKRIQCLNQVIILIDAGMKNNQNVAEIKRSIVD